MRKIDEAIAIGALALTSITGGAVLLGDRDIERHRREERSAHVPIQDGTRSVRTVLICALCLTSIVALMDAPSDVVRAFFERMEARDWSGAAELLSDAVHIEFTETAEQFDGDNFIAMNRAYPDGWTINVIETLCEGERVAAQVRVEHGPDTFWCAGFYSVTAGKIQSGVEHWVTAGSQAPPAWRQQFAT